MAEEEEVEITPEMIEAGLAAKSLMGDAEDRWIVAEIFSAMWRAMEAQRRGGEASKPG